MKLVDWILYQDIDLQSLVSGRQAVLQSVRPDPDPDPDPVVYASSHVWIALTCGKPPLSIVFGFWLQLSRCRVHA